MTPENEIIKQHRISDSGYILPEPIPPGEIFRGLKSDYDGVKKEAWRTGNSIGLGGFGEIYLCDADTSQTVLNDASLAMKIEPHYNGPLFVEMNFYIRVAKPKEIEEYRKNKGLTSLGMPAHRGGGSHIFKGDKYRFVVMDRLGKDLQKIFLSGKHAFPPSTAYNIALKVLDTLEYIHTQGYVHNDIKAQNLLLGSARTNENDLYLVDFGLASKYQKQGVHMQYQPDERKAHDGTIEYTSRDAHIGAHARRSDLESLGYNMVHWMSGKLPWMDNLANFQHVHMQKTGFMEDIPSFLLHCFGSEDYPGVLQEYLSYVMSLEFDTEPNYKKCRNMFEKALREEKCPLNGKLDFSTATQKAIIPEKKETIPEIPEKPVKSDRKRRWSEPMKMVSDSEFETEGSHPRKSSRFNRKEEEKEDDDNIHTAGIYPAGISKLSSNNAEVDTWAWERILWTDPRGDFLLRRDSRSSNSGDSNDPLAVAHRELDEKLQKESLKNPTPAMQNIMKKMENREKEREKMTWPQQLKHLTNRSPNTKKTGGLKRCRSMSWDLTPNPLTPAMEEVIRKRSNRVSVQIDVPTLTPDPSDSEDETPDESSDDEVIFTKKAAISKQRRLLRRKVKGPNETCEAETKKDFSSNVSKYIPRKEGGDAKDETQSHANSPDKMELVFPSTNYNSPENKPMTSNGVANPEHANSGVITRMRVAQQKAIHNKCSFM